MTQKTLYFWFNSGEQITPFSEAVRILRQDLNYPEDKALQFVKRFDRNNDGYLSLAEFNNFKRIIEETLVLLSCVDDVSSSSNVKFRKI